MQHHSTPYVTKTTKYVSYLLIIFGLVTALSPAILIENQITGIFFDDVPRWLWGLVQVTVGFAMLIPGGRLRITRNLAGGATFALWAYIIGQSLRFGEPTNIVVVLHFLFWGVAVVADCRSSLYREDELATAISHSEQH